MTKEEKFLVELYLAGADKSHDVCVMSAKVGINPKLCHSFIKTMVRTNFVRWKEEGFVMLTANGITLAKSLLKNLKG